ncbi:TetR/AcrR family transcriptional regulator [Streptomyces sp. DSM 40750]|uniref:TetR/AcrR family transcriptional regulator n=1 Tax=Streptomyces sp. DSM 40750 TaxID=2801030 RepID=UPI00214BFA1C|nr:TetR/AcrR family transcriptional regulator [Streptomyces sp. DSM 40750]UUU19626.1 TetR/AcrR family transcriptional regulator [Streptomyces sp. DSM 40750]UUU27032.1 TetR/AcrR family transcriptional regulator [Streptomyces sp. DSM 40750]
MEPKSEPPQRSDAQRNRERILKVALAELSLFADAPLSLIAKKAGVGQGTMYRHFPNRETLVLEVHHREVQHLADSAPQLLMSGKPDEALREWMSRLADFAMARAGLADALRQAISATGGPAKPEYSLVMDAIELLINTNREAGTIRPNATTDVFVLAIAGIWQMDSHSDWRTQSGLLLDLVMDGLRVGAPGPP